jgi:hypothetical protein
MCSICLKQTKFELLTWGGGLRRGGRGVELSPSPSPRNACATDRKIHTNLRAHHTDRHFQKCIKIFVCSQTNRYLSVLDYVQKHVITQSLSTDKNRNTAHTFTSAHSWGGRLHRTQRPVRGGGGKLQLSYTLTIYMSLHPPHMGKGGTRGNDMRGGGRESGSHVFILTHKIRKLGGGGGGMDNNTISKWSKKPHKNCYKLF